jgi:hypothetical protein
MTTANAREFESADLESSIEDHGSTGSMVAMVGCAVSLLLMLWA